MPRYRELSTLRITSEEGVKEGVQGRDVRMIGGECLLMQLAASSTQVAAGRDTQDSLTIHAQRPITTDTATAHLAYQTHLL